MEIPKIKQIQLDGYQKDNLLKLAKYLFSRVSQNRFDMSDYASIISLDGCKLSLKIAEFKLYPECGTVCCAAGYGPTCGIEPSKHDTWHTYISRVFCGDGSEEYNWCFSGIWALVDNSPKNAAARIMYMLKYGVPRTPFPLKGFAETDFYKDCIKVGKMHLSKECAAQ